MKLRSIAGSLAGAAGNVDASGPDARFSAPDGLALSPDRTKLYIADRDNKSLRVMDLNTGQVSTLTSGLADSPHYVYCDADYLMVSCYQPSMYATSVNRIYDINPFTGAVNSEVTPPTLRTGAMARFGSSAEFLVKGRLTEFGDNGWRKVTHSPGGAFTFAGSNFQNDGAFAEESGALALPGGYVAYWLAYQYPSGHAVLVANSSGNTMYSGYLTAPAFVARHFALWNESPNYWTALGPKYGTTDLARYRFTSNSFIGSDTVNLGFSTWSMDGIASDPESGTLYFTGGNQVLMTNLTSRWVTRWAL